MDWFLYDRGLCQERVKENTSKCEESGIGNRKGIKMTVCGVIELKKLSKFSEFTTRMTLTFKMNKTS